MFTGSWLSGKITQFDEQTQAVLSKITEDFVVQLSKQTAALRNHISSLEDKIKTLSSQNNQLTTDKQRLKMEKEQAKTELKNAQSEFNERLNIEDKMAKKELKNKYRDMTKKDEELEAQITQQAAVIDDFTMQTQELKTQKQQLEAQIRSLQSTLAEYKKWIDHYTKNQKLGQNPHNYHQGSQIPFMVAMPTDEEPHVEELQPACFMQLPATMLATPCK